jgi:uncharacterized protein YbjT (DUF2867 family)
MEISAYKKTALVIGANELVGRKCLLSLLHHEAYRQVRLFLEEPLRVDHPKLDVHLLNFERLAPHRELMAVDDVFYCWGSQMKLKYDPGRFEAEHTYAFEVARLAYEAGAKQFVFLSSIGADPDNVLYYRQEKRDLEDLIANIPFWAIHMFRPAVVLEDDRGSRGAGLVKGLAKRLNKLTGGGLTKYQPVSAKGLASLMVRQAQRFQSGLHYYSTEFIQEHSQIEETGLSKKDGKSS